MISDHTIADDSGAGLIPTIATNDKQIEHSPHQGSSPPPLIFHETHFFGSVTQIQRLLFLFSRNIFLAPLGAQRVTMFVQKSVPSLSSL